MLSKEIAPLYKPMPTGKHEENEEEIEREADEASAVFAAALYALTAPTTAVADIALVVAAVLICGGGHASIPPPVPGGEQI